MLGFYFFKSKYNFEFIITFITAVYGIIFMYFFVQFLCPV